MEAMRVTVIICALYPLTFEFPAARRGNSKCILKQKKIDVHSEADEGTKGMMCSTRPLIVRKEGRIPRAYGGSAGETTAEVAVLILHVGAAQGCGRSGVVVISETSLHSAAPSAFSARTCAERRVTPRAAALAMLHNRNPENERPVD